MEALKSSFILPFLPSKSPTSESARTPEAGSRPTIIFCSVSPDPWSLTDGSISLNRPKPNSKNPKNPLSDDNARRIIKAKARYLSTLRRNQGSRAQTPRWIKRTSDQMVHYLEDDRNGHLYGRHVVAAVRRVRSLSGKPEGSYNMREVMASFVTKLTFREMCVVLKEQKGWRQVRDFFVWMKLQLTYRPSVISYTIVLRMYGQVGKIRLAEQTFLEMLEAGCEPDEVACGTMLSAYARWGRHKAMLSFYSAVQGRGITPSAAVFNFMLSSLQKKSLHGNVIEVWGQMADTGVVPNQFTYTVVISSFVKGGLAYEAFKALEEMKNLGFIPEEITYSLLISLSSKNGDSDQAFRLYEDMRKRNIVPSKFTCASLLALYSKSGDYSKALSLFSEMQRNKISTDEVIFGLLIRIYGKLGLYQEAEKTFEEIEKVGSPCDEKTFIAMAQVHLSSGNCDKALSVMEHMRSKQICFSRFAFVILLQCYCMKEDLAAAEVTFQVLSETGFPDSRSCNDILNLYMGLGFSEKARVLIIEIRKNQVKWDEELLKTIVNIYCKERMQREAEQLIEELGTSAFFEGNKFFRTIYTAMHGKSSRPEEAGCSFEPLEYPCCTAFKLLLSLYMSVGNASKTKDAVKLLLKSASGLTVASQLVCNFFQEGEITKSEYLYGLLMKLGCKPEISASAAVISIYGKQHKLKLAEDVISSVINSHQDRKLLYNSIIDAFVKCAEVDKAYLFYKQEMEKGRDLGAVAISMLVKALANCGRYQEAEDVVHDSFHSNLDLDNVAYNTFIKAMLDAGKLHFAACIYERMVSSGVIPSIQTYSTMISVYGRGRNLGKAEEMFNVARATGVVLDEKAYSNLICYLGKAGKICDASHLFSQMREEGLKPGQVSFNIMINAYASAGLYIEAEELFQAMLRDGCSPDSFTYLSLVRAYSVGLKYSEAEEAIFSMRKQGISPSCAHFNILLSAFVKAGLIGEAERVFTEVSSVGLTPDLGCCQTMLRGYMDHGLVEKGVFFFERITAFVKPNRFVMSAAVHLYKSAGLELKAKTVLDSMNTFGISFLKNLEVGSKASIS